MMAFCATDSFVVQLCCVGSAPIKRRSGVERFQDNHVLAELTEIGITFELVFVLVLPDGDDMVPGLPEGFFPVFGFLEYGAHFDVPTLGMWSVGTDTLWTAVVPNNKAC
jgi:hypothetical protein